LQDMRRCIAGDGLVVILVNELTPSAS